MSIFNVTENNILKLIYNATAWANYADNAASTPQTNVDTNLATGDPGEGGTLSTSEISYTGYARVSVARTTGGWTVTNNSVSPVADITFGQMTAGAGGTVTHFATGKTGGGAADGLWSGTVSPNIVVANGVTPRLTTATTITLD